LAKRYREDLALLVVEMLGRLEIQPSGSYKEAVNTLFDITCDVRQYPLHLIRNMKPYSQRY